MDRFGERAGRELLQSGLYVAWLSGKEPQLILQPRQIEQLAAGALGGREAKVRFVEQFAQQRFVDFAGRCPCASGVIVLALVQRDPSIEATVGGSRDENWRQPAQPEEGGCGKPAQIGGGGGPLIPAKGRVMEYRQQR